METGKDKVTPKITIDKYAIRFEREGSIVNIFLSDIFHGPNWKYELIKEIQECFEECIKHDIESPKEDEE